MFTQGGFERMIARLAEANNISLDLAGDYMVQIGDTPELADDGEHVIVRDEAGAEVALIFPTSG